MRPLHSSSIFIGISPGNKNDLLSPFLGDDPQALQVLRARSRASRANNFCVSVPAYDVVRLRKPRAILWRGAPRGTSVAVSVRAPVSNDGAPRSYRPWRPRQFLTSEHLASGTGLGSLAFGLVLRRFALSRLIRATRTGVPPRSPAQGLGRTRGHHNEGLVDTPSHLPRLLPLYLEQFDQVLEEVNQGGRLSGKP